LRLPNVNQRYLSEATVSLAERLVASLGCPEALDTVFFVNSGSEAVDVARRIANAWTDEEGGLCTRWAYHGATAAAAALSPESGAPAGHLPPHVERWAPPDALRGTACDMREWRAAHARLCAAGFGLSATILDGLVTSDGIQELAPAYVRKIASETRAAGGLFIADEIQAGYGRTGAMWCFTRTGVVPDIVVMGKPMGNGYPVAACVTRRELADAFTARTGMFFSTFGGSPAAAAAAHAVMDVLEDERLLSRAAQAGDALRAAVAAASAPYPCVGDVRGVGAMTAIELVVPGPGLRHDGGAAAALCAALRRRGVLAGTCGAAGNVLKVRPPLAFGCQHVPIFVDALVAALTELTAPGWRPPPDALRESDGFSDEGGTTSTESGGRESTDTEESSASQSENEEER
jgi:4-aminobutyrate aminotransferase-like enzyme